MYARLKNITDHYGNSQTYNAYKKILDRILIFSLFETDFHDTHSRSMVKNPVSRQILAHQRNWNQSITCAAPRTTPISLGTFVPKADGGPRVCEMEAK